MPKQISQNELDAIEVIVAHYPDGVGLGEIINALKIPISRRNIQHRLVFLVRKGRLLAEGKARARLYRLPLKERDQRILPNEQKVVTIPISSVGEDIQGKISQPIQLRTPVGYNRRFLDEYRPNVSCYLTPSLQKRPF